MERYLVRIVFEWQGEFVHDFVGPFDRYFADLVCVAFATDPFMFGITPVRVLRAQVVRSWHASGNQLLPGD